MSAAARPLERAPALRGTGGRRRGRREAGCGAASAPFRGNPMLFAALALLLLVAVASAAESGAAGDGLPGGPTPSAAVPLVATPASATPSATIAAAAPPPRAPDSLPLVAIVGGVLGGMVVVGLALGFAVLHRQRDRGSESTVGERGMTSVSAASSFAPVLRAGSLASLIPPHRAAIPRPSTPPLPPSLLVPPCDIVVDTARILGRGSSATVHPCTLRGRPAAAKLVPAPRLAREAATWSRARGSEHILDLLAVCVDPPMLVSELADGGNLRDHLSSLHWPLPPALSLLLDAARGLASMHALGLAHGDVKLSNVLVVRGRGRLGDLGLARDAAADRSAAARGTPGFVAPEVLAGRPPSAASDVYALGMACYEALSGGRYPFEGHSVRAIARMVAQGTRPARPDGVPEAVWEAVAGCWEGDPGRRWTVGEVIERFEAVLRGM